MAELLAGIAIGFFMYAFINYRYNNHQWIKNRYLLWLGGLTLASSLALFFL